jgi:hypothetical protein
MEDAVSIDPSLVSPILTDKIWKKWLYGHIQLSDTTRKGGEYVNNRW